MSRLLFASAALLIACGRSAPTASSSNNVAADTLLDHLPPDTEVVVAGQLTELAGWPLWRKAVQVVAFEAPGIAERVSARCNLDPWTVLDAAALAFTADAESAVFAAQTTFDRKRIHDCLAKVGTDPITVTEGPITKYAQPDSTELAIWVTDRIVLAVPERMDEAAAIEPLAAVRPVPERLRGMLARVDRTAVLWGVALADGKGTAAEVLGSIPLQAKPTGVHAAIRRTDGLHVNIALVFADAAAAGEGAKLFEKLLADPPPLLAAWKDAIRVEARGDEARVSLDLTVERARAFDSALIAALPQPSAPPPLPPGATPPQPPR
jgi:hypothetical protein